MNVVTSLRDALPFSPAQTLFFAGSALSFIGSYLALDTAPSAQTARDAAICTAIGPVIASLSSWAIARAKSERTGWLAREIFHAPAHMIACGIYFSLAPAIVLGSLQLSGYLDVTRLGDYIDVTRLPGTPWRFWRTGETTELRGILGIYSAWRSMKDVLFTSDAFQGLLSCASHPGMVQKAISCSAFGVYNIEALKYSLRDLSDVTSLFFQGNSLLNAWDQLMETEKENWVNIKSEFMDLGWDFDRDIPLRSYTKIENEVRLNFLMMFLVNSYKISLPNRDANATCAIDLNACPGTPGMEKECILSLDPKNCPDHAEKILAFGGRDTCKRNYRSLAGQYHPDKCADPAKAECAQAYAKVQDSAAQLGCL